MLFIAKIKNAQSWIILLFLSDKEARKEELRKEKEQRAVERE